MPAASGSRALRLEILVLAAILAAANLPLFLGGSAAWGTLDPAALGSGQAWRVLNPRSAPSACSG